MTGKAIQDLVGRVMIDEDFLAELVRDPDVVLAGYELTLDPAVGRTGSSVRDLAREPKSQRARPPRRRAARVERSRSAIARPVSAW